MQPAIADIRGEFVKIDVAAFLANDFVAMMRQAFIAMRLPMQPLGTNRAASLPKNFGGASFQGVYGGIFEIDVVADVGFQPWHDASQELGG